MVDARLLRDQSQELAEKMAATEKAAHAAAGGPFNLGSPKQLQEVLYERLQAARARQDAERPAVDGRGRARAARRELRAAAAHPRVPRPHQAEVDLHGQAADRTSIRARSASTRPTTKPSRRRAGCRRRTRICRTFRSARPKAAASARRSSRRRASSCSPPTTRRSSCGSWRTCRATRACSRAFASDQDVHRATAAEVFGAPLDAVTADQRRSAKAINFGLIYGMSAFGLAKQLGIERGAGAGLRRPLLRALPRRAALHGPDARAARASAAT